MSKHAYLDPLKCELCKTRHGDFVPPEIPSNPKVIVIGEAPGREERMKHRPFIGASGKVVRNILGKTEAIILNSVNSWLPEKPTVKQVAMCRDAHLMPILEAYPHLPIISLGQWAATSVMGGKHSETSMAGEALWMYDRPVVFTYHPAYYLRSGNDPQILEHIRSHMLSALAPPFKHEYHLDKLPKRPLFAGTQLIMDNETSSADMPFYGTEMVLLGLMVERGEQAYLFTADYLKSKKRVEEVQRAFIRPATTIIGHSLNFDVLQSEAIGLDFRGKEWYDTLLAEKDRGFDLFGGYGLKFLAKRSYQAPPYEAKFHSHMRLVNAKNSTVKVADFPIDELALYNTGDLYYTKRLAEARSVFIERNPIFRMDQEYARFVKGMVKNGVKIDQRLLKQLHSTYEEARDKAERKFKKLGKLGKDFNLGSWQQLLPVLRTLVGDIPNTKEQTLETVLDKHPSIPVLLDWRSNKKMVEMLDGIKERTVKATGLVHSTITPHGAETGRASSKDPNIENWQPEMQPMMVSRYKDGVLIYPDLSAIEYRLIGHATNERDLVRDFRAGVDIHASFYKQLFKRAHKNDKERKIAKTARYSKVYGAGFKKFIYTSELPVAQAKHIFYELLPGLTPAIDEFKAKLEERIREGPFWLENMFGRKRMIDLRNFPEGKFPDAQVGNALREAFNWLFQSAGHDILELFVMESMDLIADPEVLLINDVHDEFILDVPGKKVEAVKSAIQFIAGNLNDIIEEAFGVRLRVPITAEVKTGRHWA